MNHQDNPDTSALEAVQEDEQKKQMKREVCRQYYRENCQEIREQKKAYREANREKIQAYREANRERQRASYQANRERYHAQHQSYREANREKIQAYREANREKFNERSRLRFRFRTYGLTTAEYESMLVNQGNRCLICKIQFGVTTKTGPHVDHCHATGRVRGILCSLCNTMLGHARDNPKILRGAARYLKNSAASRDKSSAGEVC